MSKLILSFHHGLLFHIETLGLGLQILGGISVHASVTEIDLVQKVQEVVGTYEVSTSASNLIC